MASARMNCGCQTSGTQTYGAMRIEEVPNLRITEKPRLSERQILKTMRLRGVR